jgi:two-component system chemotaxis response regulator CheB
MSTPPADSTGSAAPPPAFQIVAIGTSLGGLAALRGLCGAFPANFPAAVLVVMHVSPNHESKLPQLLARVCALPVEPASAGHALARGRVSVAVPDRHLMVTPSGQLDVAHSARVHFSRPAIDPLFASVSQLAARDATAVLLSGLGNDGAMGAGRIKASGGTVFAQDPMSCVAPEMPRSAIDKGFVDHVLPIGQLGPAVVAHVYERENERASRL